MQRVTLALVVIGAASSPEWIRAAESGFTNVIATSGLANYEATTGDGHGPGAVFTDLNNDGFPDLYLMRSGTPNQLYLNVPSQSRRAFVGLPFAAGAGDSGAATGAVAADYDNDGDRDLFVINFDGDNVLLQNRLNQTGHLSFVDVTGATDPTPGIVDNQHGVGNATWEGTSLNKSLTAAWADPDRDGDLDLYVGNHHQYYGSPELAAGERPGQRDVFYMNNGNGTFTDVTMPAGVTGFQTASGHYSTPTQNFSSTNAAIFADFNNDRWPDLLVTNKVGGPTDRDMLYINAGADSEGEWQGYLPATYLLPSTFGHRSGAAMGVAVGDLENDGDLDIYITDWSNLDNPFAPGGNDVWINRLSETGGLDFVHSDRFPAAFSWGTQWEDFDNNGFQDIHVATEYGARDYLYVGDENGTFSEEAVEAGLAQFRMSRGDVAADYNRDGWQDLFVVNLDFWNGPSALYENQLGASLPDRHFLSLNLVGEPDRPALFASTRDAIGARVYVTADLNGDGEIDDHETMMREVVSGSSNAASTSSLELEFGLGLAEGGLVQVLWPSGRLSQFFALADQFLTITETSLSLFGDFDLDGDVDGEDYLIWQQNFGLAEGGERTDGDADGDGDVDGGDFLAWQEQFGFDLFEPFNGGDGGGRVPVPEPASVCLMASVCGLVAVRRTYRSPRRTGRSPR